MAGTLTRTQMGNETLDNLAKKSSLTLPSGDTLSTRMVSWLDRASILIARQADLLFRIGTASTAASQQTYALPDNIRSLYTIRLENGTNSRKLIPRQPWEFDALAPKPDSLTTGKPCFYIPYKTTNTFELFPIPDATYTMRLRYSFWPSSLSSASSVSDYTYMDDVIICFATMYGFRWLQEIKDASYWEARGNEALAGAMKAERDFLPDWEPISKGFDSNAAGILGEYYNDPFIRNNP